MRCSLTALFLMFCGGFAVAQPAADPPAAADDPSPAAAETPATEAEGVQLRWKFTADKNLTVTMTQEMTQEMKVAGQSLTSNMTNKTWSKWHTDSVQDDGVAKILSTVTRVLMVMDNPVTGKMTIDTDKEAAEDGQAAQLDAMIRPMVGVEISNQMSPRGEVSEVIIPEEALAGLKGAAGGGMLSADQMSEMMQKVSPVFPAKGLVEGDSWDANSEVKTPVGTMKVDSKYTYEGPVQSDGKTLHSIKVEMKMDFVAPEGGPEIEFGDQKSTGIMLFDNAHGRLVRSDVEQSFMLKVNAAPGQVLEQTITQKMSNVVEDAE